MTSFFLFSVASASNLHVSQSSLDDDLEADALAYEHGISI